MEEAKNKVKSKLVVAKRELNEAGNILTELQKKKVAEGKPGLVKKLDYYLKELAFDPKNIIEGLDEEISVIKRETEEKERVNLEEIHSLMERINLSKEEFFSMKESIKQLQKSGKE